MRVRTTGRSQLRAQQEDSSLAEESELTELERRHREGYLKQPVEPGEFIEADEDGVDDKLRC